MLASSGVRACEEAVCLRLVRTDEATTLAVLRQIVADGPPDAVELASQVPNKATEKYDRWPGEELLSLDYSSAMIDVGGAMMIARGVVG